MSFMSNSNINRAWALHSNLKVSEFRLKMMEIYEEYQSSPEWRLNKEECLKRDNHICQNKRNGKKCGKPATIVHHKSYQNWALGWKEVEDLISVCRSCHTSLHSKTGETTPFFAQRCDCIAIIPHTPEEQRELINKIKVIK